MATECSTLPMELFNQKVQDEKVTILVGQGDDLQRFTMPKALLCAECKWFAAALKDKRFSEGETNTISLPEDSPAAFHACRYFFYNKDLSFTLPVKKLPREIELVCKIWVMADKLCIPELQDCAMVRLCYLLWNEDVEEIDFPLSSLALCIQGTVPKAALRTVALEFIVWKVMETDATIEDFDKNNMLEGCVSELFELQTLWNDSSEGEFPRFVKFFKNRRLLTVNDPANSSDSRAEMRGVGEWRMDAYYDRQSCEECGFQNNPDKEPWVCEACKDD